MTINHKSIKLFVYPLLVGFCLVISIWLLYVNFSNFVMPYVLVVSLLIACAVVSLASGIGYYRIPWQGGNPAAIGRVAVLIIMGIVVAALTVLPILVIENA